MNTEDYTHDNSNTNSISLGLCLWPLNLNLVVHIPELLKYLPSIVLFLLYILY